MKVRTLVWKVRHRKDGSTDEMTWYADSPIGKYTAYQTFAKPHRYFAILADATRDQVIPGVGLYHSGADDIMGKPKTRAKSLDDAQAVCEKHWQARGQQLLSAISVDTNYDL